ncbi:MAG: DUF72 domain-containing protein [Bryobacteraceae bacterium]|jgi:uncharacterized protein YecE (DUF72 family)
MARLFCGTSGFAYASWKPEFYPARLPSKQFLEYYAGRLNAVEINYTFRRLPSAATLEAWVGATPAGFVLCPKAHMRITHIQRLQKAEFTELFFRALEPLRVARRLGPVLFQLPPQFRADAAVLNEFLDGLPDGLACAFEFRHQSWLNTEVYGALARHGAALCLAESEKLAIPEVLTAAFVYSRLRKPDYSPDERREIAERVRQLRAGGRDCYVFFKHEETPAGALYAEELLRSADAS